MKRYKPIYRFFAAFLMIAVFLGSILPAGLAGKAFVDKVGLMFEGNQALSMATHMCCCSSSMEVKKQVDKATDKEKKESCQLVITCCCIDEAPSSPKTVPISQNVSLKIVAQPVQNMSKMVNASPLISSVENQFLKTSDSSPPIFLKNSSFLN